MVEGRQFDTLVPPYEEGKKPAEEVPAPRVVLQQNVTIGEPESAVAPVPEAKSAEVPTEVLLRDVGEDVKEEHKAAREEKKGALAYISGGLSSAVSKAKELGNKASERVKEAKIGDKLKGAGSFVYEKTKGAANAVWTKGKQIAVGFEARRCRKTRRCRAWRAAPSRSCSAQARRFRV